MSFRARVERIDADYFIPRPADEPDLDAFHAATRFLKDVSRSGTLIFSSAIAGYLLFRSGQILNLEFKWMTFVVMGAVFVSFIGPELKWPDATLRLSPFYYYGKPLLEGLPLVPLLGVLAVSAFALSLGALRFVRKDIGV